MADKTSVMRGGKDLQVKSRLVTRTMTSATVLASLPKGSRVLGYVLSGTASDAGTTATLSFGTSTSANEHVSAVSVKSALNGVNLLAGVTGALNPGVLTAVTNPIYALYAETGTASTAGSWIVHILYTTGNITDDDTV